MTENQGHYTERTLSSRLVRLFEAFPVVVITGARQVGKTTLVQEVLGERARIITFQPDLDVGRARADPELFLESHHPPLILDEIHHAPELVAAIKRRVDREGRTGLFAITGSQQWSVMRALSESLAGRAAFLDLEGFSLSELAGLSGQGGGWLEDWLERPGGGTDRFRHRLHLPFPLTEILWRGSLPRAHAVALDLVPALHSGYLRTYVERDVRLLADVSDQQLFGRFYRLAAALTGQEVNRSHLGRELGVTPKTALRWLDLLRATFQWFDLPAFSGNPRRRVSARPKGFLADTGLAAHALGVSSPEGILNHPCWGNLFETAVLAEVRKACAAMGFPPRLHHWRAHSGAEVDLVLERDGRVYPVEIKASTRLSRHDARGLRAFRDAHPHLDIAEGLVVTPGGEAGRLTEHDHIVPWDVKVSHAQP